MKSRSPTWRGYFDAAHTPEENRTTILDLIENVPAPVREFFQLRTAEGRISWQWQMLLLIAGKTRETT